MNAENQKKLIVVFDWKP